MDERNWEVIEIQIDEELKCKVEEIITPMGLTMERLLQLFFEWLVHPDTTKEAVAWLLKARAELQKQ